MSGIQLGADGSNDISGINFIEFKTEFTPSRAAFGNGRLYRKNDEGIYWKPDDTGDEYDLTSRAQLNSLINTVNVLVENHNVPGHEVHTLNPGTGVKTSYSTIFYFGGPEEVNGQIITFNDLTTANFSDGVFTSTGRYLLLMELEFGTDTDVTNDWIIQIGSGGVLAAQGSGQTTIANETKTVTISGVIDITILTSLIVAFQTVDNSLPASGLLFGPSGVSARTVTIIKL